MKHPKLKILILLLAMLSLGSIVSAQGNVVTYGETRTEVLSPEAPQAFYTLQGNAGDVLTVYALGWGVGFKPSITILGPSGQIAFTATDPLTPMTNDARATALLTMPGTYTILVGGATPTLGNVTISIQNTAPTIAGSIDASPVTIDITPDGVSLAFSATGSPDSATPVTISSSTPDFMFSGYIMAPDGRIINAFDGITSAFTASLPPSAEAYTIVVQASDPAQGGTLTMAKGVASATSTTTDVVPAATEEVTAGGNQPPANECAAVAGANGTNVRTGPGTEYDILRIMRPGEYLIVTGQNSGWYTDGVGWVAASVVNITGPCDSIGVANVTNAPAPTETPIPPTVDNTQPTATYTATLETVQVTPTYTPTATATTAAPIAVIDSDVINFTIDRDNGGTFNNDVSSPEGDTTDRVRITIDNLSNQTPNNFREFTIIVTCIGGESANLRWGTGGPSSPNSRGCNESITATHTNDSNQTFVNIAMEGPGYVQYAISAAIIPR